MSQDKPILAITMGDAAGSGAEIITKALADAETRDLCHPVVIGDAETMKVAFKLTEVPGGVRTIKTLDEAKFEKGIIDVIDLKNIDLSKLQYATISAMTGKAAFEYIDMAIKLALAKEVDAMVTSAINKESLNLGGYHYDGHTEILADKCNSSDVAMMLTSPKMRVSHVTTHVSLRRALEIITTKRIATVIRLTDKATRQMGVAKPRIAVAGINPHAGEHGLFGDEEEKLIAPAIQQTHDEGIDVTGPYPPDSVFYRTSQGQFDASIAMYHDQGHIAIKMLGILDGVNVTLGLPIIRTSVDHGTNFGKAGKGTAGPKSLIEAIKLATLMSKNR